MSEQPDSTIESPTNPTKNPTEDRESGSNDSTVLQHVTVEHDDIAVCTIFPRGFEADEISSQWLTATGDSFVSLAERR